MSARKICLFLFLVLFEIASCHPSLTSPKELTEEVSGNPRDDRFVLLTLISIARTSCTTSSTTFTNGTCYTSSDCTNAGGTASGTCAGGLGVCCYFTRTCGQTATVNSTRFINPSSPNSDTTVSNCELTVDLLSNNICQLKLEFNDFTLEQPNVNGVCETDFMTITGTANDAIVPTLCGDNTDKHLYVDLDPTGGNPKINIDTGLTDFARTWDITVHQIACDSIYRAPEGCSQYYTESSGIVESFNYATPTAATFAAATSNQHLSDQNYGICVASRTGYCSITWTANDANGDNPYAFLMSGDAAAVDSTLLGNSALSMTGSTDCVNDYVLIPSGTYTDADGNTGEADRYCGLAFQSQVVSNVQPFVMYVMTDSTDNPTDATNPDVLNTGFSLEYRQNACN